VEPVRHQDVNVVACHLSGQDRDLMFHCYLAYQIAYPNRNLSRQYSLAVLWHPHKVHFEIMFGVRPQLVSFHAPTLHNPKARLQGGGFPPSLKGTLKNFGSLRVLAVQLHTHQPTVNVRQTRPVGISRPNIDEP
jgi:hypothetical protein